ncbi:hypothetical protein BIT28_23205 [Photobacterium proteolyticum]|uniref:Transposase IS116/IS110/IS902 C-terminal domain-containing protein n=1 Tax=Photobacterium proteolyticum TaxID=1903952 RepID=A0A1Q9GLU7_9GAMM|nr:hypothetical protein BIT28_23205 [Photobacterium proteolyticum]
MNKLNDRTKKLNQFVEHYDLTQILKTVPGIGDMTASLCFADISSAANFTNSRNMAVWLGLIPRQYSTGEKPKLLVVSKRGKKQLRLLFIHGATAVLSRADKTGKAIGQWLIDLRASKPIYSISQQTSKDSLDGRLQPV